MKITLARFFTAESNTEEKLEKFCVSVSLKERKLPRLVISQLFPLAYSNVFPYKKKKRKTKQYFFGVSEKRVAS